ncbi:hypothetical protein CVT26_009076 [Gymnopilus dilepis]|uniref:Uncharacterized protein n=1 Tax=Gymnopilus dilepis TaxID=231916 RepID=A0A409YB32_9AGAR|nr:hypothetical protein CVT26_009076 [Gymnopilus dilepis]
MPTVLARVQLPPLTTLTIGLQSRYGSLDCHPKGRHFTEHCATGDPPQSTQSTASTSTEIALDGIRRVLETAAPHKHHHTDLSIANLPAPFLSPKVPLDRTCEETRTGESVYAPPRSNAATSSTETRSDLNQERKRRKARGSTNRYRVRFTAKRIKTSGASIHGHWENIGTFSLEQNPQTQKKKRHSPEEKRSGGTPNFATPRASCLHRIQRCQVQESNLLDRQVLCTTTDCAVNHFPLRSEFVPMHSDMPPPTQYTPLCIAGGPPYKSVPYVPDMPPREENFLTLTDLYRRVTRFADRLAERLSEIENS